MSEWFSIAGFVTDTHGSLSVTRFALRPTAQARKKGAVAQWQRVRFASSIRLTSSQMGAAEADGQSAEGPGFNPLLLHTF